MRQYIFNEGDISNKIVIAKITDNIENPDVQQNILSICKKNIKGSLQKLLGYGENVKISNMKGLSELQLAISKLPSQDDADVLGEIAAIDDIPNKINVDKLNNEFLEKIFDFVIAELSTDNNNQILTDYLKSELSSLNITDLESIAADLSDEINEAVIPQWAVTFYFDDNENGKYDDEPETLDTAIKVIAPDKESAQRYAEQYIKTMAQDDDRWSNAVVASIYPMSAQED